MYAFTREPARPGSAVPPAKPQLCRLGEVLPWSPASLMGSASGDRAHQHRAAPGGVRASSSLGHECPYRKASGSHILVCLEHFVFRFFCPGGQISQISPNCSQTSCVGAVSGAAWEEAAALRRSSVVPRGRVFRRIP